MDIGRGVDLVLISNRVDTRHGFVLVLISPHVDIFAVEFDLIPSASVDIIFDLVLYFSTPLFRVR